MRALKRLTQHCVNELGYSIERRIERIEAPIDVLDLLLERVASKGQEFFFIQIGANDGVTDDPIRSYVVKYHWRGILVEPQPEVFEKLLQNYAKEKQLVFERSAIASCDGTAEMFVGSQNDANANLTVFSSLKREVLARALASSPRVINADAHVHRIEVPAISVRTLLRRHGVGSVDLLQTDVQGFDREVIEQFLDCGVYPAIVHFEHCHTPEKQLNELYRRLVDSGYRFSRLENDTVAYRL